MEGSRNNRPPWKNENCPPGKLPPRKIAPRKIAHPPHELICKIFLAFNFYFCENFRLYVKSIFIPFIFFIVNNSFFIPYFSIIFFYMGIFF